MLFTRRRFGMLLGGAALAGIAPRTVLAADPDYSFVVVPDPQFLPGGCAALYPALMNWCVDNQALSVGGSSLNIKAAIGVGDCVNDANTSQATGAQAGWAVLDSNNFPWVSPPGNHDYVNGGSTVARSAIATNFTAGNFFAADVRASKSYWGTALPGGGGSSAWGGSYNAQNYYVRFAIGARKILVLSLEFQPSTPVMDWAKGIHDSYLDHECIVTTHSYLTDMGGYGCTPDDADYAGGPNDDDYGLSQSSGLVTGGNSGYKLWHNFMHTWSNVSAIVGGHWIYRSYHTYGPQPSWYWRRAGVTSDSARGQAVQQVFANWQSLDNETTGYCPSGAPDGASDVAHLFILKFRPASSTLEGYAVSTNSGLWMGAAGSSPSASPTLLFSVPHSPILAPPRAGAAGRVSVGGTMRMK